MCCGRRCVITHYTTSHDEGCALVEKVRSYMKETDLEDQYLWRHSTCLMDTSSIFEVCLVVVVTLMLSFYQPLISRAINTIKSYVKTKHANPEVLSLGAEVQKLKSDLALISPTSEFSSYFKTERMLNKKLEQYDAAVAKEKMMQPSLLKIEMGVKVVAQCIGLVLLHSISGINAFCIPAPVFWPINYLLRFPSVWSGKGCIASNSDLTPVSMFVFAYCCIVTVKKFIGSERT
ncbi:unnamed protein product [Strongylus vulgaris]|uniref:Uncharacterized protein n=1 Tax=Strongylus vulgaris TaxID=40348 RepID=A0A3P7HYX7_STRVU|nr:unnamed protein product [Strongylus vulgaris]